LSRDPDFISTEYGSALELALKKKNNAALKILIDHGANVNAVITTYEETPLMLAVDYGNVEAVQLLLDGNANVNAQEWGGGTAEGPSANSHSGRSDFIRGGLGFYPQEKGIFRLYSQTISNCDSTGVHSRDRSPFDNNRECPKRRSGPQHPHR
jgi:ankyrin repeat protein